MRALRRVQTEDGRWEKNSARGESTVRPPLALVVLAISAFSIARHRNPFGTIDVQRINVVEPNGTLRMVISDPARFPGAIVKGKQYPFNRHTAGMLF